jgi:NAD(P)-dependent dehydrogenase (short-subunit alcohol dehydrogenase family)
VERFAAEGATVIAADISAGAAEETAVAVSSAGGSAVASRARAAS